MSNYKHNCTKGPYQLHKVGGENSVNYHNSAFTGNGGHTPIAHVEMHDFNDDDTTTDEQKANAELIAEAFSVLAETGMTPRELAGLLDKLAELLADIQNRDDDRPRELTHGEYDDLCGIVTSYEQAEP